MSQGEETRDRIAVAVFARHGGRVLLVRHAGDRRWGPLRGSLMPGETPLEAAWRELWERTGLHGRFDARRPRGAILGYGERRTNGDAMLLALTFVADVPGSDLTLGENVLETRWIARAEELPERDEGLADLVKAALQASTADAPEVLLARAWLAAVNAHDVERLLAMYADDGEHSTPEFRGGYGFQAREAVKGKAALRAFWSELLAALEGLRYEEQFVTAAGGRAVIDCLRVVPGAKAPTRMAVVLTCAGERVRSTFVFRS